jgi:Tol biopolymer transport system component
MVRSVSGPGPVRAARIVLLVVLAVGSSGCAWTIRASVSGSGAQANSISTNPTLSGDGRFVAFPSGASNLVAEDTNGKPDVFVRDNRTGLVERVSVDSAGAQANDSSGSAAISANGRFVSFGSLASNLVPGDANGVPDIFVHDRSTGVTELVSTQVVPGGLRPSDLSADGRYVAYPSQSPHQINVVDRHTHTSQTIPAPFGEGPDVSISSDGRYVAFARQTATFPFSDTVVFDRQTSTEQSVFNTAQSPVLSGDGRFLVYTQTVVIGSGQLGSRVVALDRVSGLSETASVTSSESEILSGGNRAEAVSDDGRYIAFSSLAAFVPDDTNGKIDAYVRDRVRGNTFLAARSAVGTPGTDESGYRSTSISGDGRYIAFQSYSPNIVAGDTNGFTDIFVRAFPTPEPRSTSPSSLARGATTVVALRGDYLLPSSTVAVSGGGVSVDSVTWISDQELAVTMTVASDAGPTARDVSVTAPGTGPGTNTGAVGSCSGCVTIT